MESLETGAAARTRKLPTQQRSRERVERILAATTSLIEEAGSDALRMSDVAERAYISIGSLYQYFPDKGSIVRTLAERFNECGRVCVADGLREVHSVADLRYGLAMLIDLYYQMYRDDPVIIDIYSGTRADRALKDLEIDDCRQNAALLQTALQRIWPERDAISLATTSLLFMELSTAVVRLATSVSDAEGKALITEFKRLVDAQYALEDSTSVDLDRPGNLLD
ncbi:MAG: TetR/AcrR family transcriptional regulator [Thermomicrobiales bacterium]